VGDDVVGGESVDENRREFVRRRGKGRRNCFLFDRHKRLRGTEWPALVLPAGGDHRPHTMPLRRVRREVQLTGKIRIQTFPGRTRDGVRRCLRRPRNRPVPSLDGTRGFNLGRSELDRDELKGGISVRRVRRERRGRGDVEFRLRRRGQDHEMIMIMMICNLV